MEYVTDGLGDGERCYTVSETAAVLGVDRAHVRLLLRSGRLSGSRFGSQWAVHAVSVAHYLGQPHAVGRPFSEKIAWSVLAIYEDREPPWPLHRQELARVVRYAQTPIRDVAPRLRGRARAERLSVGPRVRERLQEHPLWRVGGADESVGARVSVIYVPSSAFNALIEDTNAVTDVEQPNLIAQVVDDAWWPFERAPRGAPVWKSVLELDRFDAAVDAALGLWRLS